MESKMPGLREKLGLPKMLKMLRLICASEKGDCEASSFESTHKDVTQPKSLNPQVYIIANKRMHEIETEKAVTLLLSRHDTSRVGGPL